MKIYNIEENQGEHNLKIDDSIHRLVSGNTYKDLSTVCLIPTRGLVHCRVIQSWFSMMKPMNQKFTQIFMENMEVADAYNAGIKIILSHPELSKWKYILTMEEDNMPPPDGLLKLYENIDKYDVVGGLYWTKGEEGQPMIYGEPDTDNFIPQVPIVNSIQPCNGLGMGFNLYRTDLFKELITSEELNDPDPQWFKTLQEYDPNTGIKMYTQDLYFYQNLKKKGFKVACDTRVRVGHFSVEQYKAW